MPRTRSVVIMVAAKVAPGPPRPAGPRCLAPANQLADFQVQDKPAQALLETLESVYFTFKDPEFRGHGQTRSVLLPGWRTKTWPDSMPRLPQNN